MVLQALLLTGTVEVDTVNGRLGSSLENGLNKFRSRREKSEALLAFRGGTNGPVRWIFVFETV
jgi:hypothetical protein